jgi:hypothetical protein
VSTSGNSYTTWHPIAPEATLASIRGWKKVIGKQLVAALAENKANCSENIEVLPLLVWIGLNM